MTPELRINGFGRNAVSGEFILRWQSVSNHRYTLQAATNLLSGFTLNLGTNIGRLYAMVKTATG